MTFFIRDIPIAPCTALAPMEGVTDRAFRTLVRDIGGCGLTVTEFVASESLYRGVDKAWAMAELDPDEHPVSIQIYGRSPERMAQAAVLCEKIGADIVDLNLGCPSKRVTSGCAGSALMKEPELAAEMFAAVNEAVSVPMTVKMRLGWDHDNHNAPEPPAAAAVAAGAQMVAVHGRTRSDGYKGRSRWELVRHVKEAVDVPVFINGDIVSVETADAAIEASGCDGVMVGRGVMSDPWLLKRIACAWSGEPFTEPTNEDKRQLLHRYLDKLGDLHDLDRRRLTKLKKVCGYFSKGLYNASKLRQAMNKVRSVANARALIDAFFDAIARHERRRTFLLDEVIATA